MRRLPLPEPDDATAQLRSMSMLAALPEPDLQRLAGALEWFMLPGGETLFSQGQDADDMYFVASGRLGVYREGKRGQELIAELSRGTQVGELALLSGSSRSATVRALRDTRLARLSRTAFEDLLERSPRTQLALTRLLAETLAPGAQRAPAVLSTITLVPLSEDMLEVARAMEALLPDGCTVIEPHEADARLGTSASADTISDAQAMELIDRLHRIENEHRLLILLADPRPNAWTRMCLRQCDRVMVIANAAHGPSLGALEDTLRQLEDRDMTVERQLLLVHPARTTLPSGTSRWLDLHPFGRHHHVRSGRDADLERVVRHLTGCSINLVLGGGGARAFTHVGVLDALADASIPVDAIGGASMGAVVGARFAMTQDRDEMRAMAEGFRKARIQRELTLPLISLLSTRRARRLYERLFGDVCIEDLWLPYFCLTANLTKNELTVHRKGPLGPAIMAGASPPGIWPPMIRGRELHVDGGLLNNMPTDIMRGDRAGRIIAVDVSRQSDMSAPEGLVRAPSGWRLLWQLLDPFRKKPRFPSIYEIIYSAAAITGEAHEGRARHLADVYLEPPVTQFGIGDYGNVYEMIRIGWTFAGAQMDRVTEVYERDMGPRRNMTLLSMATR